MFITFEGIDGSGKSTQIELLKDRLTKEGYRVQIFREPGGTEISEAIREILLNSELDIHPVTELLLFSAARAQLVSEKVLPLLEEGNIVILDRFYDSTTAYQGYGRSSESLDHIEQINEVASHGRKPDLTLYLKISLEDAQLRTSGIRKDRMERAGNEFFKRVIEGFDELSRREDRFVTIDATSPQDETHRKIWDVVCSALGQH